MTYGKFSKEQEEMIKQMKKARSQGEILNSIPDDMKKRLNQIMNNEAELKKMLNSERAKELYKAISEDGDR